MKRKISKSINGFKSPKEVSPDDDKNNTTESHLANMHDEKDLTATTEAISSTEAQADISKMNEVLEVSVKTGVVVDISAKVCLTPIESSPEVAMIQLDDATNTATLQNEATEQLEELIAKPIVVSVEGAIEDAVQDQGNDTNEFLVNEVEIIPVYTEGITRAVKNLEVNEEVQEILDTVETDANFDFNGSKHNEEGIEADMLIVHFLDA